MILKRFYEKTIFSDFLDRIHKTLQSAVCSIILIDR